MTTEDIIKKYGSEEAYRQFIIERGRKGGLKTAALGKSGVMHMTKEQHSAAGKLGHAAMLKAMAKKEKEEA